MYFSFGKKQITKNTCLKQHAFSVDPLSVLYVIFEVSKFHVLLTPKGSPKQEKGLNFRGPTFRNWGPKLPKGPNATETVGPKRGPFRVFVEASASGGPCIIAQVVNTSRTLRKDESQCAYAKKKESQTHSRMRDILKTLCPLFLLSAPSLGVLWLVETLAVVVDVQFWNGLSV